ncbi:MAG TPA: TIGR03013 family XrtA/PEP-CTERM system glycosyltransferase [Vicinamibacterales bacterium]|nr:TIGR03013 family XrtA/PEP-CTERM system glycosyltransferase [Vicinamibacterales bacterium]
MSKVLLGRVTVRMATLAIIEHLLIVMAVVLAAYVRQGMEPGGDELVVRALLRRAVLIALVLQLSLHYCDLYDLRTLSDRRGLVVGLIQALGGASLVLAVFYYWLPHLVIGRGVFVIASVFVIALVAGWRLAFEWLSLRVGPAERLLIVGTSDASVALARELFERRQELAVDLVGFVDPDPGKVGMSLINPGVVGTVADIPLIVRNRKVDRVVVSLADARGKLPMVDLLQMKLLDGVQFDHLASVYEEYTGKIAVENLRPSWLIFSNGFRKSRLLARAKRAFDISVAMFGLLLALPILLLVAIAIRLTSPGPVFYHQRRVGKDGRTFMIHKFRSMRVGAEAGTGAVWSQAGDPRVTPIGRFLRRTRLDELPQLWNILRGDMSFVGPRPERPEFVAELTKQIPFYGQRHVVRPGLTGWAQVRHSYGSSVDDALQKLQFDLFYIKHISIAFDLFIGLETLKTVLVRRGS